MNSEIYFSTGDFANLCNVSKQTLFYYDKINLLEPIYKDQNGFRYYSITQCDTMFLIESLKEMETPLKEIKIFINNTNPESMIDLFKIKSEQISKKIENLQSIQNSIEKKITLTKEAQQQDFTEIVVQNSDIEYLYVSHQLVYDDEDYNKKVIADFYHTSMDTLNEKYAIGVILRKDDFNLSTENNFKHLFVRTEYTKELPLVKKDKCQDVVAYHIGEYEKIYQTFDKVKTFINNHQLEIIDKIYCEPVYDRIAVRDASQYVTKITVPVKEAERSK
ncbi:MerR family DNA-binding transcriptional regulator [Jeotgalicoccus sp. S0W5]|jgi:DNA-binding transcriptional MerR regulator|uniref:MerR family DNA-binding transcriptional regulator n=1 Tax=Jeotgalicoccus sp. S0W5 TaxID=2527874 RepID=UPI001414E799|nr:MerR family DNA-binding transcriptional regulator [Jeotgalicoccus sp. S0W5]